MDSNPTLILTIDVEDWFQVENFKRWIPFSSWSARDLRVERNTERLLDLLESRPGRDPHPAAERRGERVRATFFVLGWIAERLPRLVRAVHARGHEVASHGSAHDLCTALSRRALKEDLTGSKKLLEDLLGTAVCGYRAPSFSISPEILEIVRECGYRYDSSYNSFAINKRYGSLDLSGKPRRGIALEVAPGFHELPVSNLEVGRWVVPLGGGGYFRMIPFPLFRLGIQNILHRHGAYLFYLHPWEIDPGQPVVREASLPYRLRHRINLGRSYAKLQALLATFRGARFSTCSGYLGR
ncbi:MAG: DUF3473 domain-containing protein [bacterium]